MVQEKGVIAIVCWLLRWRIAPGALLENGKPLARHLQGEQRSEECTPSGPRRWLAKPRCEEIPVVHCIEDGFSNISSMAK
jgi:hypothetical protein